MALKNGKDTWNGLTQIQHNKLDELWCRLKDFKNRPNQKGTEKQREWEKIGANFSKLKENWKIDYTETSISVEASFVSQLLAGICGSRGGYKTPIRSIESCKVGVQIEKEHFVRLIDTAKYIIHDFLIGKIKSKHRLFIDYVYRYQGTILTTKDENTRLKGVCDRVWKQRYEKKFENIPEYVDFQKKLIHYSMEEIPLIYPPKEELDMCIKSRKNYHFDLIASEVKEHCLNSNEDIKKMSKEYKETMLEETKCKENLNSKKFWD